MIITLILGWVLTAFVALYYYKRFCVYKSAYESSQRSNAIPVILAVAAVTAPYIINFLKRKRE